MILKKETVWRYSYNHRKYMNVHIFRDENGKIQASPNEVSFQYALKKGFFIPIEKVGA